LICRLLRLCRSGEDRGSNPQSLSRVAAAANQRQKTLLLYRLFQIKNSPDVLLQFFKTV